MFFPVLLLILRWPCCYQYLVAINGIGELTASGPRSKCFQVSGINYVGNWTLLVEWVTMASGTNDQWLPDIQCYYWMVKYNTLNIVNNLWTAHGSGDDARIEKVHVVVVSVSYPGGGWGRIQRGGGEGGRVTRRIL